MGVRSASVPRGHISLHAGFILLQPVFLIGLIVTGKLRRPHVSGGFTSASPPWTAFGLTPKVRSFSCTVSTSFTDPTRFPLRHRFSEGSRSTNLRQLLRGSWKGDPTVGGHKAGVVLLICSWTTGLYPAAGPRLSCTCSLLTSSDVLTAAFRKSWTSPQQLRSYVFTRESIHAPVRCGHCQRHANPFLSWFNVRNPSVGPHPIEADRGSWYKSFPPPRKKPSLGKMAHSNNPDVPMEEEELDASFSVESFFADEPESHAGPSAPPPAKKLCGEGSSSAPPAPASGPRVSLPRGNAAPPPPGPLLRRSRRDCLSTIIFPDSVESHRYKIVDRVRQCLRGRDFGGVVPKFDHAPGEILRLPRKSYCRQILQWPTQEAALRFRNVLPLTYRAEGVNAEIKFYQDPEPEYSAARAAGTTHLVIRNVPIGFATADILTLLTRERRLPDRRWLKEIRHFHKVYDPYEDALLPQLHGISIAVDDDLQFQRVPAFIWLPGIRDPLILNFSSHSCGVCNSNHRTPDHSGFATARNGRLANQYQISLGQLQHVNGTGIQYALIAASVSFLLSIYVCAMQHLKSPAHQTRLLDTVKKTAPIVEMGDTPAHLFVQRGAIAKFLAEEE
ncbi:unnamed protein product [Closterium sp. Yama58-4]|nr:unnamed protein product [Closterium sp. Yama58-4]